MVTPMQWQCDSNVIVMVLAPEWMKIMATVMTIAAVILDGVGDDAHDWQQ